MFTHVKSTIRHIAPHQLQGRHLIKVVYVVLESQYQSALSQAVRAINENNPNVAIEISGYLIEELRDKENYEEFKKDIATATDFYRRLSPEISNSSRTIPRSPGCSRCVPLNA
jgi:magnesium chelatase subunit H